MDNKYDEIFKDYLTKETCYEFLLKIKSMIKKELRKSNSLEFINILVYGIKHLKQFNEKESINTLLDSTLEMCINKYPIIPETISKEDLIKGFFNAFDIFKGIPNTTNFKKQILSYCKKNKIEEKFLRVNKCYEILAKECMFSKNFIESYNYCIKSENNDLLLELFETIDKNLKENSKDQSLKGLSNDEFLFLVARTTMELLISKNMDFSFNFISRYYKSSEENSSIINFAYLLVCLLIRQPRGFDYFWALINMYKPAIEKKYDLQFYLNKIAIVYFNKPFLKQQKAP